MAKEKNKTNKTNQKPVDSEKNSANENEKGFDKAKQYKPSEAIAWVKKLNKAKFDASVELHVRLGIDPKKGDQQVRDAVSLPHGTGKTIKVAAFVSPDKEKEVKEAGADYVGGTDLIEKIKKTEKTDFQVAVAQPDMMKELAKIAKILGTRGLMPSPKNDTVNNDPAKAVSELKKGKISFKNDNTSNLHTVIGKLSFEDNKLLENFQAVIEAIKKAKPSSSKGIYLRNIVICSSMGPGVKVSLSEKE
ncbi:MAG: 50S ribosomal protein L1 [Candidatus Pacebacteria bacterium]|nr:50S ribosomal protein L1 [Candidatus Paceibacterota bacterium]